MVARVGADLFGPATIQNFNAHGIGTEYVRVVEGVPSGVAPIFVDATGQNRIIVVKGANDRLTPADVDEALPVLTRADCIILQLEIPIETVYHTIRIARQLGTRCLLNPAPGQALDMSVRRRCRLSDSRTNPRRKRSAAGRCGRWTMRAPARSSSSARESNASSSRSATRERCSPPARRERARPRLCGADAGTPPAPATRSSAVSRCSSPKGSTSAKRSPGRTSTRRCRRPRWARRSRSSAVPGSTTSGGRAWPPPDASSTSTKLRALVVEIETPW